MHSIINSSCYYDFLVEEEIFSFFFLFFFFLFHFIIFFEEARIGLLFNSIYYSKWLAFWMSRVLLLTPQFSISKGNWIWMITTWYCRCINVGVGRRSSGILGNSLGILFIFIDSLTFLRFGNNIYWGREILQTAFQTSVMSIALFVVFCCRCFASLNRCFNMNIQIDCHFSVVRKLNFDIATGQFEILWNALSPMCCSWWNIRVPLEYYDISISVIS